MKKLFFKIMSQIYRVTPRKIAVFNLTVVSSCPRITSLNLTNPPALLSFRQSRVFIMSLPYLIRGKIQEINWKLSNQFSQLLKAYFSKLYKIENNLHFNNNRNNNYQKVFTKMRNQNLKVQVIYNYRWNLHLNRPSYLCWIQFKYNSLLNSLKGLMPLFNL